MSLERSASQEIEVKLRASMRKLMTLRSTRSRMVGVKRELPVAREGWLQVM